MQSGGQPVPTKDQLEIAGGIIVVLGFLYALIRWPLWWTFQRLVGMALRDELTTMHATTALAEAHRDTLVMLQSAVEAHGIALREIPRMSGVVSEMTTAVKRLDSTLQALHQDIRDHGEDIGEIRGALQGGGWQGEERRRKGRRSDDPPLTEEPG